MKLLRNEYCRFRQKGAKDRKREDREKIWQIKDEIARLQEDEEIKHLKERIEEIEKVQEEIGIELEIEILTHKNNINQIESIKEEIAGLQEDEETKHLKERIEELEKCMKI